jgi:predicted N-acetyltransferase YhbS
MIHIRAMTEADLPLGMRLRAQAGWNQTEADWRRYLRLGGDGCFVAELDGAAVGTTMTFLFGPVAWVAMVLVDEAVRGRGVGTALTRHALAFLDGRGVRSVRLDATPLGRPIYEKLGFVAQYEVARYEGTPRPSPPVPEVHPVGPERLDEWLHFDRAVTATDRRELLLRLFEEHPAEARYVKAAARGLGFLSARPGAKAAQIGPCVADPEAGLYLFADAWHRYAGRRVFVDVPTGNALAVRLAEAQGLTVQRRLTRMCRGEPVCERVADLWASSGPAKG